MKISNTIIICPSYKEAFILRRALIDLGINWYDTMLNNVNLINDWKDTWDIYKESTVYQIVDNKLTFGIRSYNKNFESLTVEDFVKKYIRTYENR